LRPEPRPLWSGTITFGLVSIPVDLVAAQRGKPGMKMLSPSAEHAPVAREYYCPKDGEALTRDDIVRGYPLEKDKLVPVTDEELKTLAPRRSRDIDLQQFVEHASIDPMYFRRAYFLVPSASGSGKAYRLLADTMERTGRAGIARFVMRDTEYLVAIFAENGILRAETLRFADELRGTKDIPLPKMANDAALTKHIAKAVSALAADELDDDELGDEERAKRAKQAGAKRAKGQVVVALASDSTEPVGETSAGDGGGKVIDIMKLLKERMAASPKAARKKKAG
jgi:DNA end-binding protein Ku